jgi:hypothetical protein
VLSYALRGPQIEANSITLLIVWNTLLAIVTVWENFATV